MKSLNHWLLASILALSAITARADEEQDLIAVLKSSAGPVEKSEACKKLRLVGTTQSVSPLAALLADERISQAARYALESIPSPEAGAALRDALGQHSGLIKVGLIDSLGWRRDAAALPLLAPLLSDADASVASTTASALGRIGGNEAVAALKTALGKAPPLVRPAAVESLFRCAEQLLAEKKPSPAEAIYKLLFAPDEEARTRIAAYAGLMRCANDGGIARIKSALEGSDSAAQVAALQLAARVDKKDLSKAFADLLPKATPELQVGLLALLKQDGDVASLPAVMTAAGSQDMAVQAAAVAALGDLGDASAVPLLAQAATSPDAAVQAAARNALASLHRGNIAAALIAQLSDATPPAQLELIRALTARSEKSAVPELLRLARSERPTARKAALSALASLARGSDAAGLVQLLADARQEDIRSGVHVAFERIAEREGEKPKWKIDSIMQGLAGTEIELRKTLLPISVLFVDERLRASIRAALKDGNDGIRGAAARAVCDARDIALVPDLLTLARQTPDSGLRSLALERVVRLEIEGTSVPARERADALAAAMALASTQEDKRMVLSGVAQAPHRLTLELAEKACADPMVKAEAEQACLQIAGKLGGTDFDAAEASLKRLASSAGTPTTQTSAQALLKKLNSGWLCAGPYRKAGKQGEELFDVAFPPEQPGAADVQWRRAPGSTDLAKPDEVDLASIVGGDHCVVYLKTRVYVPTAQAVRFSIGSDDGIKLWVNGELVHANNAVRGLTPDQDKAKGRLREGWNDLQAKITQHTLGCGMTLRIASEDGKRVSGLQLAARSSAP